MGGNSPTESEKKRTEVDSNRRVINSRTAQRDSSFPRNGGKPSLMIKPRDTNQLGSTAAEHRSRFGMRSIMWTLERACGLLFFNIMKGSCTGVDKKLKQSGTHCATHPLDTHFTTLNRLMLTDLFSGLNIITRVPFAWWSAGIVFRRESLCNVFLGMSNRLDCVSLALMYWFCYANITVSTYINEIVSRKFCISGKFVKNNNWGFC